MTTEVTVKNTGHNEINVNECVPDGAKILDQWKNEQTHTLKPGESVSINIWRWKNINVVETCSGE